MEYFKMHSARPVKASLNTMINKIPFSKFCHSHNRAKITQRAQMSSLHCFCCKQIFVQLLQLPSKGSILSSFSFSVQSFKFKKLWMWSCYKKCSSRRSAKAPFKNGWDQGSNNINKLQEFCPQKDTYKYNMIEFRSKRSIIELI